MTEMFITDQQVKLIANEAEIIGELLHLEGATVLELG
jgi:hypothetical protein